ncbi:CU044_5270 family protein [Streptomyces sp. NPDC058457]|uniref:CU044_5270 family protein n=1 Tax=Streptomyces sp. NPDC058457 TaxID=3346507 RepID=UPI003661B6E9
MDEMTKVRELRADAPVPDRARLAPGRTRLVEAALAGERRRALWQRREFVIIGVVAAVTAVAVTVSLLLGGGTGRKVEPAASPTAAPSLRLKGVSAAEFLRRAADVLDTEPDAAVPTAKQWIYTKSMQEPLNEQAKNATGPMKVLLGPRESWLRYDGTAMADLGLDTSGKHRKLSVTKMHLENGGEGDDRSPREMYRVLAALPADGEQTLKALRETNAIADAKGESQARNDYGEISVLLTADVMPPKGLASLYRALATLPGGDLTDHLVETASGRRVIALGYGREDNPKTGRTMWDQWLIDPQTYRIVGMRMVEGDKVVGGNSIITKAVVDEAGDRG